MRAAQGQSGLEIGCERPAKDVGGGRRWSDIGSTTKLNIKLSYVILCTLGSNTVVYKPAISKIMTVSEANEG